MLLAREPTMIADGFFTCSRKILRSARQR